MQTFTLTLYGASVTDVQRLLTEAGLTGLSFAVTWDSDEPDDDVAAVPPSPTDNVGYLQPFVDGLRVLDDDVYPPEGYYIEEIIKAKRDHPSGGGS